MHCSFLAFHKNLSAVFFILFPAVNVFWTCTLHFDVGQSVSTAATSGLKIAFLLLTWKMSHAEQSHSSPLSPPHPTVPPQLSDPS